MNIAFSVKDKLENLFSHSKKLVQPPQELPEIKPKQEQQSTLSMAQQEKLPTPTSASTKPQTAPVSTSIPVAGEQKKLIIPKISIPEKKPIIDEAHPAEERRSEASSSKESAIPLEVKSFEDAINNINIDIIHSEEQEHIESEKETKETISSKEKKKEAPKQETIADETNNLKQNQYYEPKGLGEGYFSEIEHYVKNKNFNKIADDILKKDFLANMKKRTLVVSK